MTMIPRNINRTHVINAIQSINTNPNIIPPRRNIRKYRLVYNGRDYPPKFVVSLANRFANGVVLNWNGFGGGSETNDFLRALGFTVI